MSCCRGLLFLAVIVGTLTAVRAQNARGPAKDVLELASEAEKGKDVATRAAALKKNFRSIGAAMRLYNPRDRGGFGFGPKGVGMEYRLVTIGEDGISADVLKKESAELRRLAAVSIVMGEVVRGFAPAKPFLGRGKKEWDRDVDAMKAASASLLKAIEANSPKDVRTAVTSINNACNNCHDGKK
jgi:hypothetical protein